MTNPRPTTYVRIVSGLAAACVLAAASPALADHYPNVRKGVQRKDQSTLDSLRRLTHTEHWELGLAAFECNCLEPTCEEDFMLSCGGELEPYDAGFLTAVRRTSRETCLVCGCTVLDGVLIATPVCAGF